VSKWIVWLGQDYITHDRPALEVIQTNKTQIALIKTYISAEAQKNKTLKLSWKIKKKLTTTPFLIVLKILNMSLFAVAYPLHGNFKLYEI